MLEKILTKMAKVIYPERDISVEKLGGRFFLHPRDTTGCNTYLYGLDGLREVASVDPISQMSYVYDSRFKAKEAKNPRVFDMDCKLKGVYSYNEAKLLSTGTLKEKDGYSGEEHPIFQL